MIATRAGLRVWVATQPIDFRRGVHGLVALVAQALCADPYGGEIFVFRSKRHDRIKLLAWDGSGMVLATKWLESGKFVWPPVADAYATVKGQLWAEGSGVAVILVVCSVPVPE